MLTMQDNITNLKNTTWQQ